jgi:hypothetical protein
MALGRARSWRFLVPVAVGVSFLFACAASSDATGKKEKQKTPINDDDFFNEEIPPVEQPIEPDGINTDSGAFGAASERPSSGSRDASVVPPDDAGTTGPRRYCGPALAAGDLAIVEVMISSKAGSGDSGEWIEIQSTRDCWLKLKGVVVESPRGAAQSNVATIVDDFELAPRGTFVVADSTDPVKNHGLPGKVIAWEATDVLKNDGDTITVRLGSVQIDTLTYPAFSNLTPGRAVSFPADCVAADRASWARWSLTFNEFSPGFKGTPNAPNDDVACF